MRNSVFFLMAILLSSAAAHAQNVECADAEGSFRYTSYTQEGGPCCGRWSTELMYKGQSVKKVDRFGGTPTLHPPLGGDTDPSLVMQFGARIDLANSGEEKGMLFTHYALSLTLTRAGEGAVFNDDPRTEILVSLVCRETHFKFPPP